MRKENIDKQSGAAAILLQSPSGTLSQPSPSGLTRGSTSNNKANWFDVDSRIKSENDSGGNENGCGWKRSGGAAVAAISAMFCLGAGEALAQCAVPPTCESLGYNKTAAQCGGTEILKCPFDTSKVFCNSNYVVNAKVGDIYYSDGTISTLVIPEKTPIGIVAYVEGNRGLMVALDETSEKWSTPGYINLSCLPDLEINGADADMNGKTNTACILSETSSGNTYPAAEYCNNYKPVSSGKGSSGWYLPAAGELKKILSYYSTLNASFQILSKTPLSYSSYHWTSSESNNSSYPGRKAWVWNSFDNVLDGHSNKYDGGIRVRCVLDF